VKKRGVTLLEMIVVMAIIIIITAVSAPSFLKFTNTSRLRGSARDITTALRTARRLAITTRTSRAVAIYLWDYSDPSIRNAVSFHETRDSIERRRAAANISFTDGAVPLVPTTDGYLRFNFSPRGTTQNVGTISVVDPDNKYIEITVNSATGRVKISEIKNVP
jgi:prepilin-type N-terminal cleavage/methylation domain-containing protein